MFVILYSALFHQFAFVLLQNDGTAVFPIMRKGMLV